MLTTLLLTPVAHSLFEHVKVRLPRRAPNAETVNVAADLASAAKR